MSQTPGNKSFVALNASSTLPRPVAIFARCALLAFLGILAIAVFQPTAENAPNAVVAAASRALASLGLPYDSSFAMLEFLANIALFVPAGVLLPLAWGRLSLAVALVTAATGLILSLAIEATQLLIPGRVSDPRDIVANTIGALVGTATLVFVLHIRAARGHATAT